jgi:hypothetical protein
MPLKDALAILNTRLDYGSIHRFSNSEEYRSPGFCEMKIK